MVKKLILILLLAACQKDKDEPIAQPIEFDLTGQWVNDTTEYSIGLRQLKVITPKTITLYNYTWIRSGNLGIISLVGATPLRVDILEPEKILIDYKPYIKR